MLWQAWRTRIEPGQFRRLEIMTAFAVELRYGKYTGPVITVDRKDLIRQVGQLVEYVESLAQAAE